jgi:hypothetical protein
VSYFVHDLKGILNLCLHNSHDDAYVIDVIDISTLSQSSLEGIKKTLLTYILYTYYYDIVEGIVIIMVTTSAITNLIFANLN